MAQSIHGTATCRERLLLPPSAAFEATLEDVSRAGFRKALSGATRWSIARDRLELFDAAGGRLAQFEALEGHDR